MPSRDPKINLELDPIEFEDVVHAAEINVKEMEVLGLVLEEVEVASGDIFVEVIGFCDLVVL